MKMYEFFNSGKKIGRDEFEVVEKLNSYERVDSGKTKQRIKKSEVDVLRIGYASLSMYTFDGNPENFIKMVIAHKETEIEKMEATLAKQKNDVISLQIEFQGYISNNVQDGQYHTRGELFFKMTDDGCATGTPVANEVNAIENIHSLYTGIDFSNRVNSNKATPKHGKVMTIYVQGRRTNLAIEGTEYNIENPCLVTREKFAEMVRKTKIEVNFQHY